jgi:hypothetical protein
MSGSEYYRVLWHRLCGIGSWGGLWHRFLGWPVASAPYTRPARGITEGPEGRGRAKERGQA